MKILIKITNIIVKIWTHGRLCLISAEELIETIENITTEEFTDISL